MLYRALSTLVVIHLCIFLGIRELFMSFISFCQMLSSSAPSEDFWIKWKSWLESLCKVSLADRATLSRNSTKRFPCWFIWPAIHDFACFYWRGFILRSAIHDFGCFYGRGFILRSDVERNFWMNTYETLLRRSPQMSRWPKSFVWQNIWTFWRDLRYESELYVIKSGLVQTSISFPFLCFHIKLFICRFVYKLMTT